jgi:N-acetylglutamate synthase-like GNAT family acetyltransferase
MTVDQSIIRLYHPKDKKGVLALFDLNTPATFAPEERIAFDHYLDHELDYYVVLEVNGQIVGCGGYNLNKAEGIGYLSWDMVHPDYQGNSLGKRLVNHRLEQMRQLASVQSIHVRTSQHAYAFYEKCGFKLMSITEDYWAENFHLYHMVFISPSDR